jgi:hypothetical protein
VTHSRYQKFRLDTREVLLQFRSTVINRSCLQGGVNSLLLLGLNYEFVKQARPTRAKPRYGRDDDMSSKHKFVKSWFPCG